MNFRSLLLVLLVSLMSGCASKYTYHQSPTPLKNGVTKYYLDDVKVDLTLGEGARPESTEFYTKDQLTELFKRSLNSQLSEKGIAAVSKEDADAILSIYVNYKRKFNWGGKSLNSPHFGFKIDARDHEKPLATYDVSGFNYKPDYGFPRQTAVDLEIASFLWGADDEKKDIDRISYSIVYDVSKFGK